MTVMSALRMTSIVALAVRAGRSGSGVGESATAVFVTCPVAASAGTSNVTTTLAVSPGRRSPTAHGNARARQRCGRGDRPERRPAGATSLNTTSRAVDGPWLAMVMVNSAAVPAATASPVATFVAWRSADCSTAVVTGRESTGVGLASEVNDAVFRSSAPSNDGSSVPAMRTVTVVPGSIDARAHVIVPAASAQRGSDASGSNVTAGRQHVGQRRRRRRRRAGIADRHFVGDLAAGGERGLLGVLTTVTAAWRLDRVGGRRGRPIGVAGGGDVAVFVAVGADDAGRDRSDDRDDARLDRLVG